MKLLGNRVKVKDFIKGLEQFKYEDITTGESTVKEKLQQVFTENEVQMVAYCLQGTENEFIDIKIDDIYFDILERKDKVEGFNYIFINDMALKRKVLIDIPFSEFGCATVDAIITDGLQLRFKMTIG